LCIGVGSGKVFSPGEFSGDVGALVPHPPGFRKLPEGFLSGRSYVPFPDSGDCPGFGGKFGGLPGTSPGQALSGITSEPHVVGGFSVREAILSPYQAKRFLRHFSSVLVP